MPQPPQTSKLIECIFNTLDKTTKKMCHVIDLGMENISDESLEVSKCIFGYPVLSKGTYKPHYIAQGVFLWFLSPCIHSTKRDSDLGCSVVLV